MGLGKFLKKPLQVHKQVAKAVTPTPANIRQSVRPGMQKFQGDGKRGAARATGAGVGNTAGAPVSGTPARAPGPGLYAEGGKARKKK